MREEKRWLRHDKIVELYFYKIATRKFDKILYRKFYSGFHHHKK